MESSPVPIIPSESRKPENSLAGLEHEQIKYKVVNLLVSANPTAISTRAIVNMKARADEGIMRVGESDESTEKRGRSPNAFAIYQKAEEKPKPPTKDEIPPAPPPPVTPPETELPPAPPSKPKEPEKPKEVPLRTKVSLNIAAEKQQIEKKDDKTGIVQVEEKEVMEAAGTLGGWKAITEGREIWQKGGLKKFVPRFWKDTLNLTGTYGKEKTFAMKKREQMGLQVLDADYDFEKKLTELARNRVEDKRQGKRDKFGGFLSDLAHEFTYSEKDLHKEQLQIIKELVDASLSLGTTDTAKAQKYGSLLTDFVTLMKRDYAASASLASKLSDIHGPDVIHQAAGEIKGVKKLQMTGGAQQYLIDNIVKPLLDNGLKKGDGHVDDDVLLRAIKAANDFQFTPQFREWYKLQLASPDKEISDSAKALHDSFSYGNDLVDYTIKELLGQAVEAKKHIEGTVNLDQWIEAIKSNPFEVALGTLEAGPKESVKEGFMQKAAGREIRYEKVKEIFALMDKQGSGFKPYPERYEDAAANRALLLKGTINLGKSSIAWGMASGLAIYAGQSVLKLGSGVLLPIVGGSFVGGAIRGAQEGSYFQREYEQHNIEDELGYQTVEGMKRREQMDTLMRHKRWMQKELTDEMTKRMESVAGGKEKEKNDGTVRELMGLLSDTKARFEIMDERGVGLLASSNSYSYQIEKTNLDFTQAETTDFLGKYFAANPDKFTALKTELGMDASASFQDVMGKLVEEQRLVIETGAGVNLEYQKALGLVNVGEADSIKARENAFKKAKVWKMTKTFGVSFVTGMVGGAATRKFSEFMGWGHAAKEAFDPNKVQTIQDIKVRLPPGFQVQGDKIIDTAHNNALIYDLAGKKLSMDQGLLFIQNGSLPKIPFSQELQNTGLFLDGKGADLAGESFASSGGVEREFIGSLETSVPAGTHWQEIASGSGHFNLVPDDPNNHIIIMHDVQVQNGRLLYDASDSVNARFISGGGSENPIPVEDPAHPVHEGWEVDTANKVSNGWVEDPTNIIPDTGWMNKLAGLKENQWIDDPMHHYRFEVKMDALGRKGFHIVELLNNGKDVGEEVGHNLVYFDAAKNTISFEAMQGNAIPEKLVKALDDSGLVKRDELYKAIRLDAADQVMRVPANLDQIYNDNKVADFSDNVRWLSHGGWAKPAGAVYDFESGENTYLAPIKDWQPIPMVETVDGKQVFSLAHFLNSWEDAKIIDEGHVQVLSGPNAGKIMEINQELGQKAEGSTWLKEAAKVGKRVAFDSNQKNRIVMEAPEGFLNDLKAVKEGHGDLSRFFVEERFDSLSTKGVIAQFKGNSIWNAFADPSDTSKSFGDNAFADSSGNVRGWTHFMWTEKPGDFSTVYSFANTGPTQHFSNLTLHNPLGPSMKEVFTNGIKETFKDGVKEIPEVHVGNISSKLPSFNFDYKRIFAGDYFIPFLPIVGPRTPLEAHEAVRSATTPTAVSGRGSYTGAYATISTQTGQTKAKTEPKPDEIKEEKKRKESRDPVIPKKYEPKLDDEHIKNLQVENKSLQEKENEIMASVGGEPGKLSADQKQQLGNIDSRRNEIRRALQYEDFVRRHDQQNAHILEKPVPELLKDMALYGVKSAEQAQKLKDDEAAREQFILVTYASNMAKQLVQAAIDEKDKRVIAQEAYKGLNENEVQILTDYEPILTIIDRAKYEGNRELNKEELEAIEKMKVDLGLANLSGADFNRKIMEANSVRIKFDIQRMAAVDRLIARADMKLKLDELTEKIKDELASEAKKAKPATAEAESARKPSGAEVISRQDREEAARIHEEVQEEMAKLGERNFEYIKQVAGELYLSPADLLKKLIDPKVTNSTLEDLAEDIVIMHRVENTPDPNEEETEKEVDRLVEQEIDEVLNREENAAVKRFYINNKEVERIINLRKRELKEGYTEEDYLAMLNRVIAEANMSLPVKERYNSEKIIQIIDFGKQLGDWENGKPARAKRLRMNKIKKQYQKAVDNK